MGYYATATGSITYKTVLSREKYEEAKDTLLNAFDTDGVREWKYADGPITDFTIFDYDKYDEDEVIAALNKAAEIAEIEDGCVEYVGEDHEQWRFVYKEGEWKEERGEVVYENKKEHFAELLRAYVENDLEVAEPDYVRDVLESIGATKEDLMECGLGYLVEE